MDIIARLRYRRGHDPLDVALDAALAARRNVRLALRLRGEPDREFVREVMGGVVDVWLATDAPAFARLRTEAEEAGLAIDRDLNEGTRDITRLLTRTGPEGDRMVDALARVLIAVPSKCSTAVDPEEVLRNLEGALSGRCALAEDACQALVAETRHMMSRSWRLGLPGLILCGPAGSNKQRAAQSVASALARSSALQRNKVFDIPALRFLGSDGIATVMLALSAGAGLMVRDLHPLVEGHHLWESELGAVVALLRQASEHPSVLGRRLLVVTARTEREVSRFLALHRDLPTLFRPPIHFEMPDDEALARTALPAWHSTEPEAHVAAREAMALLRSLPGFAGHRSALEFCHRVTAGQGNTLEITAERVRAVAAELAPPPDPSGADRVMGQIEAMVGLGPVAAQLREVVAAARANAARRRAGLPQVGPPPHLLLLGEPGTGKTTVARLIGPLLHAAGALARPEVIEVGRAELIGEYIGQTAPLVSAAFERAKGGVLFVDEAYALRAGSDADFGHEALATLVALMENERTNTVVVLAGYTDLTLAMVDMNPGLASRIGRTIRFPDLSVTELTTIFARLAESNGIELGADTLAAVANLIASKGPAGGGRMVRSLFERACERHALRCATGVLDALVEPLRLADIPAGGPAVSSERSLGGYL